MRDVFVPAPGSPVQHLDRGIREDLAASLGRIAARAQAVLPPDVDIAAACEEIRAHRLHPNVFAAYYDLVHALQAQDWEATSVLWRLIAARAPEQVQLACTCFDPAGPDAARVQRHFARGWQEARLFARPDDAEWTRFRATVDASLGLLHDLSPAWRAEVDSLLTRIYAAVPPAEVDRRFSGSSSLMVWGAIFLNARLNVSRLRVISGLVHEATHQMLFGLSRHEALTRNPPALRYPSPLRRDPRPMDGVYHATYVSGRLCLLFDLLRRHGGLTAAEQAEATERFARQKLRFAAGHDVIRRDGLLSPLGQGLIEAAAAGVAALPA